MSTDDSGNDLNKSLSSKSLGQDGPQVERNEDDFVVDAALVGELLEVPPSEVPDLIRSKHITSVCERGTDADDGMFRLNLFYRGRHARLRVDPAGRVLHRSVIDFGKRPPARAAAHSLP